MYFDLVPVGTWRVAGMWMSRNAALSIWGEKLPRKVTEEREEQPLNAQHVDIHANIIKTVEKS